ncbi:VCBS domain-containing protein [Agarivorans sp. MS3-6]
MTQDKHDKSSRNADEKRAKNSAAKPADKDKGIQKAKRIDEDVARLKAKELRDVKTVGLSNQDLVADKSTHQLLAGAEQADRDLTLLDEPQAEDAQPDHVAAEQHTPIEQIDADNSELSAGAALDLKATAAEHALGSSPRIGQGGGLKPLGTNQWYSPHSFLSNSELASSLHNAEFKPVPHHLQASLAVKQIAQVKHFQSGAAQPIAMHAEGKQQQSGIVKEDQTSTVSGELHIAGLGSASATWSVESGSGKYGQLVVDPDTGQWRYVLNNSCVDTNALAEGEHHTEQFLVFATNNNHQHVKMLVSIEVEGSNDLPVISGLHHASVAEMDKLAKVDGQLLATDPDHNEHLQWALANPHGQFGSLSINATTGEWQYLLDNKSAATLALTEGQQVVEHFVATVTDSSGQAVKHDVSVLVTGSNEQAAISGSFSGIVTEDKNVQAGELHCAGLLQIQDPDAQQASFISEQLQGQFGQFQIDTDGYWTYSAANSSAVIQGLKTSESLTDTMLVHSVDGTEKKITITINGTDDKAVISNAHLSSSTGLDKGAPSPDGETYASITEDINVSHGNLTADGALTITDVDNGQAQFSAETLQGQFGTLSINELGHWTYTADNSQATIQGLKTGEALTDTLLVHSVDGTEQKITVTINGTDDKAVIGGTSTASLTEDKYVHSGISSQELRVDGALTITDVDSGQAQFGAETLQGQFGTLTINNLGHWTYTADNSQPTIQGLKTGESVTDTVFVHSVDGTEQKITVTINGTDDKAIIAGTSTASLTEDKDVHSGVSSQELRVDGLLTVTDPDAGQSQFAATSLQGQFGTLSINELGHWTYTADNSQPSIQGLKTGESVTDTLVVHSVDGTEQKITVTINGTDDKAIIGGTSTANLTEDKDVHGGQLRVDGALTITDADAGQNQFAATSLQGQFGTLSINELGHWTYTADNSQPSIQGLKTGESVTDTVLVHSVDGTEQKITVTINGTDDKAVIAGTSTANLTEDKDVHSGQLRIDGALTVTDVDNGQAQFSAESLQGQFGTLSINNLGHWTYTADNSQPSIQGLKTGESVTDAVLVHSIDGTEQKITVTINGTDDKAQIAGASTANITEDKDVRQGQLRVDGALNVTDSDNGQAQFSAETLKGQFGTLTINELGHWTYTAENSQATIQGLKTGEALTDTLVVHSVDGTEQKITVTINGTDDKAVIAGTATASLTEDKDVHSGLLRVDGALTITDSDNGQAQFSAETLQGQFGTLTINNLGHWTYTADNSQATIQGLKTGESVTDTLLVHSVDGTEQQVTVTINGTDDKAVIAGSATASLTEDKEVHAGQLRADGALTVTDLDNGQAQFQAESLQGQYGTLTLNNLGHWTYTADNSQATIQGLKTGESVTDTLLVHSVDGAEQQVTVTINGTDDKAVIAGSATASLTEDKEVHAGQLRADGALTVTDLDNGQAQFQAESLQGQYGTLTLNNLGHWTYIADNSKPTIQGLQSGESLTDSLVVHSVDGTSQQISVTINGSDDKAVIAGTSTANLTEDKEVHAGQLRVDGALTVTDLDNGQAQFQAESLQGQYGTLTLNNLGHWTYTADNSKPVIQGLQTGESLTDTLVVHSVDGTSQQISITINGSNDKPIVTAWTQLASGTEDKPVTIKTADLLKHATDVDATDILQVDNLHATNGHLTDNKDGSYTFTPDKDFNGEVRLTYNVIDGHGGSVGTQAKFDLAAAPDQAVITDAQTDDNLRGVTEDRGYIDTHYKLHYNGQLNIHDPDVGQDHFDPNIGPQTYEGIGYDTKLGGHVVLTPDGHYTYTLDNRKVQNLAEGEVKQDSVVIRSADGTAHTIELSVHGTNDRPTIAAQSHSLIEGGAILHGKMVGQDVDTGAVLQYSAPKIDGLIFNSDGSYSFDPSNSSYQSLSAGTTKTLTIPVTITDEHNAHSTQNLSIIITGVNNAAVIGGVDTGDVNEATAGRDMSPDYAQSGMSLLGRSPLYANGAMTITDLDAGEETFNSRGLGYNYTGKYGDLMLREDGSWSYYADAGNIGIKGGRSTSRGTEIDHLGDGQTLTDTITVYSKDGTAHDIVITIHGSNDRPYCSSEVTLNVGSEDTRQTITAAQLLSNTVDVDRNDAGLLTIENLHVDHGSIAINPDGSYLFTPEKDYNGAVKFNYDIKDGHGGITHTQAKLTLTASQDAATFTGDSTGDVHEGHTFTAVDGTVSNGSVGDRSPDHQHGNIGKLWNDEIHTDGHLNINDADSGEAHAQTGIYHGNFGQVILQTNGDWSYYASIGQDATGRTIDKLGQGQSLTDTVTIKSSDGTPHNIVITIHGSNDRPYCSSEVQLNAGTEDTRQTITVAQLLTNTVDVDNNDIGLLTIENLHPDHGSIATNSDGSFSFTPEKDYNGQVHFTYDVKDGHGGITHTSASTTLSAVNDNPDNVPVIDSVTEDTDSHHAINLLGGATDVDGDVLSISQIQASFEGSSGALPQGVTVASDGHSLIIDSHAQVFQHLGVGEKADIVVHYMIDDNHGGQTSAVATITMVGADDKATLAANVIQMTETQALDSAQHGYGGRLQLVDPDTGDNTQFVFSGQYIGQGYAPGDLTVWPDGSYQFRLQGALNRHADDLVAGLHAGESKQFPYEIKTSDGQTLTIMVKVTGEDSNAQIHVSMPNMLPASQQVTEEHFVPASATNLYAGGRLQVVDPDHDQSYLQAETINTAHHGQFNISADGGWNYTIDNSIDEVQKLGAGESFTETHTVHSLDGTASQLLTVTVQGTNDAPVVSAAVKLAPGIEDTDVRLSKSELLANTTDVDHNDIGQLDVANLVADHGTVIDNKDGTFSFVPEKDYNGAVQFNYDIKDAHGGITHTQAGLTLTASQDAATFSGDSTGDVHEGHTFTAADGTVTNGSVGDRSPDHQHGNIGKLWNDQIHTDGHLNINDADSGEAHAQTGIYHGNFGQVILQTNGDWSYYASIGQDATGRTIDKLGQGQSLTDTVTITSADGTTHDIVITIHGDNDRPYCSSLVTLNSGTEDKQITLTAADLLANTIDVDANDAGKLSIDNLHADHGSILNHADGSFTFTPEKDYNGAVHFSYDVKDAHGGVTHTGATTSLVAIDDHTVFGGITTASAKEDVDSGRSSYGYFGGNSYSMTQWHQLTITDTDSKVDQVDIEFGGKTVSWQVGTPLDIQTDYGKFELQTYAFGSHKGELVWLYNGDNNNPSIQGLKEGESLHESITLVAPDGTRQSLSVEIKGTEDHVVIDAPNHLGDVIEHQSTGAQVSGQLHAHDTDTHDSVSWTVTQTAGKYGELSVDTDGHWHYVVDEAKAGALGQGDEWSEHFTIEALSTDGSKISKTVSVAVRGSNDAPTVTSGLVLSQGREDTQVVLTQHDLLAYASDVDSNDRGWLRAHNLTADNGTISTNADGSFTFTPDKDYNGDVQFTYDVTDRHGGVTATSATMNLAAIADAATISGATQGVVFEDHGVFANNNNNTTIEVSGHIFVNDPDAGEQGFRYGTGTKIDDPFNGHLHISENGTWVYDVDNIKLQHLAANEEVLVTHRVYSKDGTPQDIVIKITGTNDNALINGKVSAVSQGTLTEDSKEHTISGTLTLTDVDTGEDKFATISQLAGQYGYLSMDRQGNWSYTLDNSLATTNGLVAGQVVTESFTVTSPDGTASHTINVQIHGHDDTPSLSVNEGGAAKSLDLLGGLSSGTVSHMQFSTDGVHYTNQVPDGFMLASDGHTLQVDPAHNSYNHLANGIALKVDIKYELQQGAGRNALTSQQQAQVVVTGTSDRPILHSFNSHSQQNSGPVTGNLLQGATDIDDGAHLVLHDVQFQDPTTHQYVTVQAGQAHNITGVGLIAISANGDYSFTPNSQFSGQVPNLIYRVTDTNGDYADNSQNNLDIHIDPYQAPIIIAPLTVALANDTGSSATDLVTQDGTLSISGQTAGMQVEYSIDGGKNWSTQFSPIEGVNQLQVRQTDSAGHASTASSIAFTLDTHIAAPHISLDPITADDVLNQAEISGNLPITGTVGRDVNVGDTVTLKLGTLIFKGVVDAQHRFSIDVPASQMNAHTDISATVTTTDAAGNSASATDNHHYSTDTIASIRVNPITSDNIIEASEHHQAIDIAGTVSGVEDGQVVTVSIGGHHYQAVVAHGAWSTSLTAVEVQALPGGTVDVTASVHDLAGNLASIHSPLFVGDSANPVPSLSFKAPPTPTGGGSIGSHISGDLVVPPLIQQLTPNLPSGGWAITDGKGHTSTSLHGQYGTLTIDPDTGHVDYVYSQAPTPGNKAAGGSHWAGQTTSEEHHDVFQVVYHDAHASNVDVKVNLDVTYVHGHSGHNQTSTHLVAMTVTPDTSVAMPPAADMHDAPDDIMTFSASITEDEPSFDEAVSHIGGADENTVTQPIHAGPLNQSEASSPIDHYVQMVGISHADITPASESPLTTDLPDMAATLVDPDADMFDTQHADAFENPLDDDKSEQHNLDEHVMHDDNMAQHEVNQDNDDDLLHQALNDMHNQW